MKSNNKYTPRPRSSKVIFGKARVYNEKTCNPGKLTKAEWEREFTLENLKQKWSQKYKTSFGLDEVKFPESLVINVHKRKEGNEYYNRALLHQKDPHVQSLNKAIFDVKRGFVNVNEMLKDEIKKERVYLITPTTTTATSGNVVDKAYKQQQQQQWNKDAIMLQHDMHNGLTRLNMNAKANTTSYWSNYVHKGKYVSPVQKFKHEEQLKKKIHASLYSEREALASKLYKELNGENLSNAKMNRLINVEMEKMYQKKRKELQSKEHKSKNAFNINDVQLSKEIGFVVSNYKDRKYLNVLLSNKDELHKGMNDNEDDDEFQRKYKEIAHKMVKKVNEMENKYCETYVDTYYHSGKYVLMNNNTNNNGDVNDNNNNDMDVDVRYYWSCCMKENKNAKGCCKVKSRKHKWLYD